MIKRTGKRFFCRTMTLAVLLTSLLHAQNRPSISATSIEPSQPAAYIFEVVFDSQLSPTSQIEIVFPKAFNVNTVMMAVSEKLDGALDVTREENAVFMKRNGSGTTLAAGDTVDIKIASIINPSQMNQEWDFTFVLSDGQIEIEKQQIRTQIIQTKK